VDAAVLTSTHTMLQYARDLGEHLNGKCFPKNMELAI
jgi:hypothetical protein